MVCLASIANKQTRFIGGKKHPNKVRKRLVMQTHPRHANSMKLLDVQPLSLEARVKKEPFPGQSSRCSSYPKTMSQGVPSIASNRTHPLFICNTVSNTKRGETNRKNFTFATRAKKNTNINTMPESRKGNRY